jgi:hypothetical protein
MQMEETQNVEAQRRKRFETVGQVFLGPTDERHTRFGGRDDSWTLAPCEPAGPVASAQCASAHGDVGGSVT